MKYSLTCPVPCNHNMKVDAKDDNDAIEKFLKEGKKHAKQAHPDMPDMGEGEAKEFIRTRMKKM